MILNDTLRSGKMSPRISQKHLNRVTNNSGSGIYCVRQEKRAGLTQEDLAEKLHTKKSAVSRIENHSEDIRLSTLSHYAEALGKKLTVVIQ